MSNGIQIIYGGCLGERLQYFSQKVLKFAFDNFANGKRFEASPKSKEQLQFSAADVAASMAVCT